MKNIKISNNRADMYFLCHWRQHFNEMPYYNNIPYFVKLRAIKNYKRWTKNSNSLFNNMFSKHKKGWDEE